MAEVCVCHGEPMYRNRRGNGQYFWSCAVRKRAYQRDRYDADPIHRITKNLGNDAQKRRKTLDRHRAETPVSAELASYLREVRHSQVPL